MGAPMIISLGMAAASAGMAYKNSKAQKEAQENYNDALEREAIRQYQELDEVESDALRESHAQSLQAQRNYMEARSAIELQSAVTGTYGRSINMAIEDLNTGLGGRMSEIVYNREARLDQIDRQAESIQAGTAAQADRTVSQPAWYSAFSSGLSTGTAVYGAASKVDKSMKSASKASG